MASLRKDELETYIAKTIFENLLNITDINHYHQFYNKTVIEAEDLHSGIKPGKNRVGFLVLEMIYDGIDLYNPAEVHEAEQKLSILLKSQRYVREGWQETIGLSIKNLILKGRGNFNFRIDTYDELMIIVNSWINAGMFIEMDKVEAALITDLARYIKKEDYFVDEMVRVAEIMDHHAKHYELKAYIEKTKHKTLSKSELIKQVKQLDKSERLIFNGKHRRNHNLARYYKQTRPYKCENCNKSASSKVKLEVSHTIPLYIGPELGGVDRTSNLEILCRECHKTHEENFRQKFTSLSSDELKKWIVKSYPFNPEKLDASE